MNILGHRFNRRETNYFMLLVGFVVIGILFVFVLIPKVQDLFVLQSTLREKQEQLSTLTKKKTLLDSLDQQEVQTQVQETESALPQDKDAASVLAALDTIAGKTQIGIDSINFSPGALSSESAARIVSEKAGLPPTPVKNTSSLQSFPVYVTVRGDVTQFLQFIQTLLSSRRLFDIEAITANYVTDSPNFLTADLTLTTYYVPQLSQIGTIESPLANITAEEVDLFERLMSFPVVSRLPILTEAAAGGQPVGKSDLFSP